MESILASVIIPVYKVEKYLKNCVNSVINNAKEFISELEIILVDDGSPDLCPKLCDELARQNSVVIAFHKENGGLSSARNYGQERAKGKYLIFLDSDDSVNEKFYDMLTFIKENDFDFIECGCKYITDKEETFWTNKEVCLKNVKDEQKAEILDSKLQATAWSKVVNRKFFIDNKLYFREGYIHEDEHYMPRLLLCAKSICITNKFAWYNYFLRGGSIITSYSIKNAKHILDNMKNLKETLEGSISNEKLLLSLKKHLTRTSMGVLLRSNLIKKEDKKAYFELLNEYKSLFKKGYNFKQKLVSISIRLFGFKFTTKIIKIF